MTKKTLILYHGDELVIHSDWFNSTLSVILFHTKWVVLNAANE